jgi:hypothetical protein
MCSAMAFEPRFVEATIEATQYKRQVAPLTGVRCGQQRPHGFAHSSRFALHDRLSCTNILMLQRRTISSGFICLISFVAGSRSRPDTIEQHQASAQRKGSPNHDGVPAPLLIMHRLPRARFFDVHRNPSFRTLRLTRCRQMRDGNEVNSNNARIIGEQEL